MAMSYYAQRQRWRMKRGLSDITASTYNLTTENTETEKQSVLPLGLCRCKIYVTMTLKYHRHAPGLATLESESGPGVYLKRDRLDVCRQMSDDPISFARLLAVEIFTTKALSACSVTKEGDRAIDYHHQCVERAIKTIWEYVIKCADLCSLTGSVWNYEVTQNTECIMKGIELKLDDIKRAGRRKFDDERLKEKVAVYDTNDSRWTLKHPQPGPGLVELMKHSGVYVDAYKLAECKRWSVNSTTLMSMLLHEVFTMCALTACAEDDDKKRCNISKLDSLGLHEDAVVIVVKFVEEHAKSKDWKLENNRIMRDICWYLNNIRGCGTPSYLKPHEIFPYPKSFDDPIIFDERMLFLRMSGNECGNKWFPTVS
ncbi:hypothetical protein PYW07_004905 [Mythimna separata]|uniref:BEN domain-containing protein n=1 Tax=Mythimna separata TaxID=271217 RepID=A0AAD7YDU6_MYTSE|nr:hypothetical protein PYW07_004905 [Mythimna separata]